MSASIQIFKDESGSIAVPLSGSVYDLFVGPSVGLDGDTGEEAFTDIYVKNTGDQALASAKIVKVGDPDALLSFCTEDQTVFSGNQVSLGDIAVGQVIKVTLLLTVPAGSAAASGASIDFCVTGISAP